MFILDQPYCNPSHYDKILPLYENDLKYLNDPIKMNQMNSWEIISKRGIPFIPNHFPITHTLPPSSINPILYHYIHVQPSLSRKRKFEGATSLPPFVLLLDSSHMEKFFSVLTLESETSCIQFFDKFNDYEEEVISAFSGAFDGIEAKI